MSKGFSGSDEDIAILKKFCLAIKKNQSAYEYYKNAYEFSKVVFGDRPVSGYKDKSGKEVNSGYGLENLDTRWAPDIQDSNTMSLSKYEDFQIFSDHNPEYESSNFNKHRRSVIRHVIETNLSTAISSYSSKLADNFLMPKISEEDWSLIENNTCAISFMQGMSLGFKKYNGYCVVANSFTQEHIDEHDIYILKNDYTYCRVNDSTLADENIQTKSDLGYYAGIWKLDVEKKQITDSSSGALKYYIPKSYVDGVNLKGYTGSYTSIVGIKGTEKMPEDDVYKYLKGSSIPPLLKKAYYYALGRERWGAFNIVYVNLENNLDYFLMDYTI